MGHHHHHDHSAAGDGRIITSIIANLVLTVAQIVGGILSGSLALIADALHNFSDVGSILIAYIARRIARRPPDPGMTFGYGRIEVVAALVNYTSLFLVGLYLITEGVLRLADPPEVGGWIVIVLGTVALVVDAATALLTGSIKGGGANIRALFLHNLSDALTSVAVVVSGALILLYDWRLIDPLITIGIALYILWMSVSEVGGVIRVLMLGSPPDMDSDAVLDRIHGIDGVAGVHHAHFWLIQENTPALDTHVVVTDRAWTDLENLKQTIKTALETDFGIHHSTLEFEHEANCHEHASEYGGPDGHP